MRNPTKTNGLYVGVKPFLGLLLGGLVLVGCGQETSKHDAPDITVVESAEPPAVVNVETDGALPDTAVEPVPALERSDTGEIRHELTPSVVAQIQRGMTREAVEGLVGWEGLRVGGDGGQVEVLRWVDDIGSSVTVRFDGGQVRTSGRLRTAQVATPRTESPTPAPPTAEIDGRPVAEIAPGVFVPLERAVTSANSQPMGIGQMPDAVKEEGVRKPIRWVAPGPTPSEGTAEQSAGPTITVGGAGRRGNDGGAGAKSRSYQPHARLPEFTRSLAEGRHEIRLLNDSDVTMTAGLRQGKMGQDLVVPPKGKASAFVERGVYTLSFLCDDEPYARYDAEPITIDGQRAPDVAVHLSRDEVDVRLIDYSVPE